MTSCRSEHGDQDGNDRDSDDNDHFSDGQNAHDGAYDDDDGGDSDFDFDASPSLSPLSFSPVRPLSPSAKTNSKSVGSASSVRQPSPVRSRDNMKRAPGTAFFRRGNNSSKGDGKAEEVSPMPKLTQLPRTKPSLLLKPKLSLLQKPKPVPLATKAIERVGHSVNTRSSSPARERSPGRPRLPESPPRRAPTVPRPCRNLQSDGESEGDDDELSSLSPPSSVSDRADMPGSSSLDSLVGRDLAELRELLSNGKRSPDDRRMQPQRPRGPPVDVAMRSWTSDDVTAVLRQSTRFRRDDERKTEASGREETAQPPDSSFRLRLDMLSSSKRPPTTSERRYDRDRDDSDNNGEEQGEESFVEELNVLGASLRKSQELDKLKKARDAKLKAAAVPTRRSDDLEISEATTAKIRAASDAIDKALLLARQPFERRKKQQEQADAADAAAATKAVQENPITSVASAELPIASQRIVEQLDLAFGDLTQQRNAELKAAEDSAAAAKQVEEEKQKADADTKAAAEKAAREQEMEVLRLLPLHGKLLSCSMDIDEALIQLEASERWKHREARQHTLDEAKSVADAIATLRVETERKIREIEAKTTGAGPVAAGPGRPQAEVKAVALEPLDPWWGPRQSDLLREHFDAPAEPLPTAISLPRNDDVDPLDDRKESGVDGDFHGVIQREVVEKLDLTILKLRHVLSVNEKETQEAAAMKKQQEEARQKQQDEKATQEAKKKREFEDAEAARQRVMGLTSLDQVHEWTELGDRLRATASRDIYTVTLSDSVGGTGSKGALWQSEFDHEQEMQRFQQLERSMQGRAGDREEDDGRSTRSDTPTDDYAHRPRSGRYTIPERTHCDAIGAGSDDEQLDRSYYSLVGSTMEPIYSLSGRPRSRIPMPKEREGPVMLEIHSSGRYEGRGARKTSRTVNSEAERRWEHPPPSMQKTTESTRRLSFTTRTSATGRRTELERSIAATFQALQSDRRAKAKWFKRSIAL